MNTAEMMRILDSIARDRKIDKQLLIRDLERSMVSAARKHFNSLDTEEFRCELDTASGRMTLYRHGQPMDLAPEALGRIAAQTFKQVMIQGFRDDERQSLLAEFSGRVGEIVSGQVQRYDGGAMVVTIDRAEAFMPRSEQIPGEQFQAGDRVRCMVLDVRDVGSQVKIVLSRAHPDFIKRLFEIEVPEVAEKIIEIKAMAREPGHRTKLAVASVDSKVDPVGACVGVRGSRIKVIVEELSGEKIDIVRWNDSSQILIGNALKPAEVQEISLCFELGRATVVVRDDQLSLAIGKRGQNVRLAARLTGWDVDILTPEEYQKGLDIMSQTLLSVPGVTEVHVDRLAALGMVSVFDIEEVGAEVLVNELEIDAETAKKTIEITSARAKEVAVQQQKDKEQAERTRREQEEAARRLLESGASPLAAPGEGAADVSAEDQARADKILGA
ncbi:MAG: transcription termination factor NusA [Planctomyces sp.]|nr:transcription termination factor NusA [Planctomyces sp.]MBA4039674.1 transcription termination factor NusA [Planctomyces sp.]MBA4119154.1 transcription termination factor NusA [Isosphaera sp.]